MAEFTPATANDGLFLYALQHSGQKSMGTVYIGGHAGLLDGEVIVIGSRIYEWDDGGGVLPGNIAVLIGANAVADIANLIVAINANKPSIPVTAVIHPTNSEITTITADAIGAAGNLTFTTTMSSPSNLVSGPVLVGGEDRAQQIVSRGTHILSVIDATSDSVNIDTALVSPRFPQVLVCDEDGGVVSAYNGDITIIGSILRVRTNGLMDGYKISWMVFE
jgi:hypothetical protein